MFNRCPIHVYTELIRDDSEPDRFCPKCKAEGKRVVECEVDKIARTVDTLGEYGWQLGPGSYAVLVFVEMGKPPKD